MPKITDFGLAKLEDAMTLSRTGDFAGTPFYMSPEQVTGKGKGVDRRTDIYSLGVTLYEMLTLRQPFEGKSSYEVLKKIPVVDPIDPWRVNPRVPKDLSTICLKAMEKSPEKRYQTMKEFGEDLQRYLSGEVVLARPTGITTKIMKRIKRNPLLSGAVGMAVLTLLALIAWGVMYFIQMKSSYDEIMRHSDLNLVYRLRVEAEELWPAYPWMIEGLKDWFDDARGLLAREELYRLEYERLRSKEEINVEEAERNAYLERLIPEIDTLGDEEHGLIMNVARRLHFAHTVHEESIGKYQAEWDEAIASIADEEECPQYDGLVIEPILGFVPIGRDPDSGLWEFAHVQTGEIPWRDKERRLVLNEETGLMFVLIPAGSFFMGAVPPDNVDYFEGDPNVDPEARGYEGPVHSVTIEKPFFLSKYEMTQGQWLRFTGNNPSYYKPGDIFGDKEVSLLHPVTFVSWKDCDRVLFQLNLRLPSEGEWEYAARAGTTTVWWTGNDKESLKGAANIRDRSLHEFKMIESEEYEDWINDGYAAYAPVGSFLPNAFGLHDVIGNVYEWCQDTFTISYERTPVDGSVFESPDSTSRVFRGGSVWSMIYRCRSANRRWFDQTNRSTGGGLRPAFSLP
jgi:formylglycine-generating enzyme required for sulfatase activity